MSITQDEYNTSVLVRLFERLSNLLSVLLILIFLQMSEISKPITSDEF